ncbi:protein LAZY 1-like [Cornus florida]|uniref:protein LAZY 1-like n=1 Tax=Cornus florida TaxID=4283 RepID=UPI00289E8A75|nr:protein LAZY 1-like [Cornus florida]
MKLLGWMHRRLRRNSNEPFKDFTIGNSLVCLSVQPSLSDQQYYSKPSYSYAYLGKQQGECQEYSSELKTNRVEEFFEEETAIINSELFNGFLTIGTLGQEPINSEPPTPTFPMPFESVTGKKTEVTENELKLINDELEKFLQAEAKEMCNGSSERSSVSTITLSGKQIEGVDTEEYGDMVLCPLQGYLSGSSIELFETSIAVNREKRPLEQPFKKSNIRYKHPIEKHEDGKKQAHKTYATHFMKKMLKKLHSSSKSSKGSAASAGGEGSASVSTKRKLPKVLRMFCKKIHPERSAFEKESTKSHKHVINKTSYDGCYDKGDLILQDTDNRRFGVRAVKGEEAESNGD